MPTRQPDQERLALHFTARQGWLNDPHGICWVDGQYHLFYQHNPAGTVWSAAVEWGHAVSPDLVRWREQPVALKPRPDEEGCWTGAVVMEDGRPVIFYTSVLADDWHRGRITLAFPDADLDQWRSDAADVLVDGAPDHLQANVFRDPCIFEMPDGWRMIVGVGVAGGDGLVVQYRSADRRDWTYDGVVCSRPGAATDEVWTGSMWECPQLFPVGDAWVLVVSVWADDQLFYCAAGVGDYDGRIFTPRRWTRLTHDDVAYAMTSFRDRAGEPCVMFWIREEADHDSGSRPWAGLLSLPMAVQVNPDDSVQLFPHPDLASLRTGVTGAGPLEVGGQQLEIASEGTDVVLTSAAGLEVVLTDDDGELLRVVGSADGTGLSVSRPGRETAVLPVCGDLLRLVVDRGIVEVFSGSGSGAFRVRGGRGPVRVDLTGAAGAFAVHPLSARG